MAFDKPEYGGIEFCNGEIRHFNLRSGARVPYNGDQTVWKEGTELHLRIPAIDQKKLFGLLPGFLACLVIALIAQVVVKLAPTVGAALFAIGIGMFAGNTFLNRPAFDTGTKFSESRLLEYSIVLTGMTLDLNDMLGVGLGGIGYILCQMALTITAAYLIGRRLGFGKKFVLLMCAGNAVCGSSAIGTVAPIVKSDAKDKGISITIVNVTGTALMILLPVLTGLIYGHEVLHTSAMIGGTLQSIGQVIASAEIVGGPVIEMSTIFKIIRIIFLVLVALTFSKLDTEEGASLFASHPKNDVHVKARVPWFIIGFFIFSVVNSLQLIPAPASAAAKAVSSQFEIIALAAIGMRVKFADLLREGPRAMLYGGLVGCCQILFALALIFLFFH